MGKTKDVNPWLIDKRGWLQNKDRKKRRNKNRALTDDQVLQLISDINTKDSYTKLNERYDRLIRERDKALIALGWIFFKRANEIIRVQLKDCHFNEKELTVTFYISKKSKSFRICPECKGKKAKNAKTANFCKNCGMGIRNIEITKEKKEESVVTKRKSMEFKFCQIFVEWIKTLTTMELQPGTYVFPPFKCFEGYCFDFSNHISRGRFTQILQRLDSSLFTHLFRYGAGEKYLLLGYTREELEDIGDWADSKMPKIYAKRAGVTPAEQRWSKDPR